MTFTAPFLALLLHFSFPSALAFPGVSDRLSERQSYGLTLPSSGLPAPSPGLTLQYVALGIGTQNYTCAGLTADDNAQSIGAVATLYDATTLLQFTATQPYASSFAHELTCAADHAKNDLGLPVLGYHYFLNSTQPKFDLSSVGLFLSAEKKNNVTAPKGSCVGRTGGAAVAWLQLVDDGYGESKGLKEVYRVQTTGGTPVYPCAYRRGPFEDDYAAQYWFFS